MSDEKFTSALKKVAIGAQELIDWGQVQGLLDEKKFKLTIEARAEQTQKLIANGMSQREAAKVLGVGKGTIQRDLGGPERSTNGPERATKEEEDDPDLPEGQTIRARYQRSLIGDSMAAIAAMTKKTRKEFFAQLRERYGNGIAA